MRNLAKAEAHDRCGRCGLFEPVAAFPEQPTEEQAAFGTLAPDGYEPFYRLRDKQTRQRVRVLTTNGGLGTGGTLDGVFGPGSYAHCLPAPGMLYGITQR